MEIEEVIHSFEALDITYTIWNIISVQDSFYTHMKINFIMFCKNIARSLWILIKIFWSKILGKIP